MNCTKDIIECVKNLHKPTLARIITYTHVKMNKKDVATKTTPNPYIGAVKVTTLIVTLAPSYESTVNDQRLVEHKEADFEAESRVWGESKKNGIVEHNGNTYISYIAKEHVLTSYFLHGDLLKKSDLEPFIPKSKPSSKQGLDTDVVFRTVDLKNVIQLEIL